MKIPYGPGYLCMATHPKTPNKDPRRRQRMAHVTHDGKTTLCSMMALEHLSATAAAIAEPDWYSIKRWTLPAKGICKNCRNISDDMESEQITVPEPTTKEEQSRAELFQKVAALQVVDAWNNPGPHPDLHTAAKMNLKHQWPLLYKTVKRLAETHGKNI